MPLSYSTSAPAHSSGVDEKRWKWSRSIFTTWSASASAASTSPQSKTPDQTTFEPASSWRIDLVLQGLLGVDEHGELVVLDLDELGGVARELSRRRADRRDGLSHVAHASDRERVVLDVPARLDRHLEEGIRVDRDLVARDRPVHALELERLRDVDRDDLRVGVRRADEVDVAHAVPAHVVEERALALDEPLVLLARDRLPDEALLRASSAALDVTVIMVVPHGHDRLDDVHVARAAADVPLQRDADLLLGRAGSALEECGRAHQHPGRAVAALEGVVLVEGLLERRQVAVAGEALDRRDLRALGLDREQHAALHRLAVQMHRAGAAVARVAADVRPREPEVVADEVDEEAPRRHLELDLLAVDLERDGHARDGIRHYAFLLPAACRTARVADTSARWRLKSRRAVHVRRRIERRAEALGGRCEPRPRRSRLPRALPPSPRHAPATRRRSRSRCARRRRTPRPRRSRRRCRACRR